MLSSEVASPTSRTPAPWRRTLLGLTTFTALGAWVGAAQLLTGTFTPPVSDLEPLGLTSWTLPGIWLLASVAMPCTVAAVLAGRGSPRYPVASLMAGVLLVVELLVQIPFVGLDPLQAVMGAVALAVLTLATRARRALRAAVRWEP